jgi:2,4-dienoyl-CoA reductase-like NADH-dependent reductase (Old Yellow Enzyme family)
MASVLFSPITMRGLTLPNRVVVSPMCQYNSDNGSANDWHLMHLGNMSLGCAGLVMCEMTNVNPQGRISAKCAGMWSDDNEKALKRVHDFCRQYGVAKLGVQLAHAGRKGPTTPPAAGGKPILTKEEGGWTPEAPSAIPYDTGWPVPHAMTKDDIKRCLREFAEAAKRVDRIGYDVIELHGAHGYLAHQFLSPLSNQRIDEYGGSLENRMRFAIEMYESVRAVWPEQKPLGMRVSATDWVDGGWTPEETVILARELKNRGMDYMDVSSGGVDPRQKIPLAPSYRAFCRKGEEGKRHNDHDRRSDRGLPAGRRDCRLGQGGPDLPRARSNVGSALGLARSRGTGRRNALCAQDDGMPSQAAAAAFSEAGTGCRIASLDRVLSRPAHDVQ